MIKLKILILSLTLVSTAGMATAESTAPVGVDARVALIRTLSSQIVNAKKHPSKTVKPEMFRVVENAWLGEIKGLEAYCLSRFGKTVWLAPYLPDDAANAERPAEGEDNVSAGEIKSYRIFKHRSEFIEDRLQKIAVPECK